MTTGCRGSRVAIRSSWHCSWHGASHGAQRSMTGPSTRHPYCTSSQRRGCIRRLVDDANEAAALQELASLSAASGDLVLGGADGLLAASRCLDREQIALAGGRDEPEHAVVVIGQLDENDALAGARQIVHLGCPGEQAACLSGSHNHDFRTTYQFDAN